MRSHEQTLEGYKHTVHLEEVYKGWRHAAIKLMSFPQRIGLDKHHQAFQDKPSINGLSPTVQKYTVHDLLSHINHPHLTLSCP